MNTLPAHRKEDLAHPPVTYHSLTVPVCLLAGLSDNPLAIGLYGLVARLFITEHTPIPLSPADVQLYDPCLSRSAIVRAFTRLVRDGWLIEQTKPGHKTCYTPAWGLVSGSPRAWRIGATLMNRPRHTQIVYLNKRLLDICMGKLRPHGTNPALVERYFTHPILRLADIGAYLLLDNGGRTAITERLVSLELVRNNHTAPVPSEQRLLALGSQQTLFDTTQPIELTRKGLRRLGCPTADESEGVSVRKQPLFFVPPGMFGSMTVDMDSNMSGSKPRNSRRESASECGQMSHIDRAEKITWKRKNQGNKAITTPLPPTETSGGGGQVRSIKKTVGSEPDLNSSGVCDKVHQETETAVESETVRLLRSINVRPTVISELADQPAERVQSAIADGKMRPEVRDIGGWVVSLLRLGRDHDWTITPPRPKLRSGEVDWSAEIAKAMAAGLVSDDDVQSPVVGSSDDRDPNVLDSEVAKVELCPGDRADVGAQLIDHLRWQLPRAARPVVERLVVRIEGDTVSLLCGRPEDIPVIQRILPTIAVVLRRHGWPRPPRLIAPAKQPDREVQADNRPAWIDPVRWTALPAMLRAALQGATVVDGRVQAVSVHLARLLETRYSAEVARLLAEAANDPCT